MKIHQIVPQETTNFANFVVVNSFNNIVKKFSWLDILRTVHVSGYKKIHNVHSPIDLIKWLLFKIKVSDLSAQIQLGSSPLP